MKREVRVGVLASGRGSNLEALYQAHAAGTLGARLVCVASDNRDARALQLATQWGLPTFWADPGMRRGRLPVPREEEVVAFLRAHRVDLVCLAGFMRILGAPLLGAFPDAILNIHPALLPSFPGLEAQRQALDYGVKISGCTVHFVDAGVDTGPIVAQAAVPVLEDDTAESLAARILVEEHRIYPLAVRLWAEDRLQLSARRVVVREPSQGGRGSREEARS